MLSRTIDQTQDSEIPRLTKTQAAAADADVAGEGVTK